MNGATRLAILLSALLFPALAPVHAQGAGAKRNRPAVLRPDRRLPESDVLPGAQPNRSMLLQQQIRRTLWRVTKQRLSLSDDQMLRLERTSQRFEYQRRGLAQEEKAQRIAMRVEILADSAANQGAIATALDQLHSIQQRRLDLQAAEQKEFEAFLTPLQRARFMALQEQVRRRLQEVRRGKPDASSDPELRQP